jgi:hypothetical protein
VANLVAHAAELKAAVRNHAMFSVFVEDLPEWIEHSKQKGPPDAGQ